MAKSVLARSGPLVARDVSSWSLALMMFAWLSGLVIAIALQGVSLGKRK